MPDGVDSNAGGPLPGGFDPTQSMELVWQGQRGDRQAVNALLERYRPRLRRVLDLKISPWQRSSIDPEDILQETMWVATQRLPQLQIRTPTSILRWLAAIADKEIMNRLEYLKAQKRDPAREQRIRSDEDSTDSTSGVLVPFRGPTASQFYARRELDELIASCAQVLEPADYREVFKMRFYYKAEWEEIRLRLGRPTVEAVQDLYSRAKERLREMMAKRMG